MKNFFRKQNFNLMKVLLAILVVLIIFLSTGVFSDPEKSLLDYIEVKTFIAIVLFFILDTLSYALIALIGKKVEDKNKLTKNYDHLINRVYPLENVFTYTNPDQSQVKFPSLLHPEFKYPSKFILAKDSPVQYPIPEYCRKNYRELLSAHRYSKIRNSLLYRLDDLEIKNGEVRLSTSRTTSYDGLVTNRCMDYQFDELSVRQLYEMGPFLSDLKDSKMANHMGYNLYAMTSDDYLLMFYRRKDAETYKGSLGPTMTNIISALTKENKMSLAMMEESFSRDLVRRLKLSNKPKITLENNVIGITRNLVEGGAVQLVLFVRLDVTLAELCGHEIKKTTVVKDEISNRKLLAIKKNNLLDAHLEIDRFIIENKKYKSSPSALVPLAVTTDYLRNTHSRSLKYQSN